MQRIIRIINFIDYANFLQRQWDKISDYRSILTYLDDETEFNLIFDD